MSIRCRPSAIALVLFAGSACSSGSPPAVPSTIAPNVGSVAGAPTASGPPATESARTTAVGGPAPVSAAVVVDRFAHDPEAFTEGLLIHDGTLVESTGLEGSSEVRVVDLASGEVRSRAAISPSQFGEGVAVVGAELFQLTWTSGVAHVYDRETLRELRTIRYDGEGWGLTTDGEQLVMSDGSDTITWRDPATLSVTHSIRVHDDGTPIHRLNELELVDGELWANVWMTTLIARIDPADGRVIGWIDLGALRPAGTENDRDAVANGIAFDSETGAVYVTGKRWDVLYRIERPA